MKKIRLLVDARGISGEGQGTVTYLRGIYTALHKYYGEYYDLFFCGYDAEKMKKTFPFMKQKNYIALKHQSKAKLFLLEFPKVIRAHQIDFAHFQYVTPFVKNCKFIVTTHDVLFNDFKEEFSLLYRLKRNFLFKRSLIQSEIRLTVSEYSKKQISHHYGIPQTTIAVTPNAAHDLFFAQVDQQLVQKKLKEKYGIENYILFVSRIESRKNHQLLVKSYRDLALAKKDIQMVFIGNDTLNSEGIVSTIKKLKASFPGHFHWFKYLGDEELIEFYRGASLFIYPSKAEGFGIPPIEAAATGINTLCARNTAMKDFDFFNDNLFSPEDPVEFKEKLLQNLYFPPSPGRLKSLQNTVREKYNWKQGADIIHTAVFGSENNRPAAAPNLDLFLPGQISNKKDYTQRRRGLARGT